MHRHRRSLWLWLTLLEAALAAGAAWTNTSGRRTSPDPLSGSPDSALTTPGPASSSTSTFTWTGTDSSLVRDVASCESEKRAWYTASSDWYWSSHSSYSYESTTGYDTLWLGNYTGSVSTLCDGVPRASGPAPTTTVVTQVYVNSIPPPYASPSPTCTFNYRGCELVVESYRSWYSTTHVLTVNPPLPPLCEWGPDECKIPYGEEHCRLDAGEVKLIYWPQSKDPAELCASTKPPITTAPVPTSPVVAVSGDFTFSSPSVYLSFAELKGLPCYKTWHNAIIPVASEALSTIVFGETQPIERTTSLNWNDMNSPIPLSAYKAQQSCWDNWLGVRGTASGGDGCNTIYDDYLPWLALPTNPAFFTGLDPLFKNCTSLFWRKYVFDPPYALTPVGELLPPTPTATTDHVAESAQLPSASAVMTVPVMTTIAQPRYGGPIATVGTQEISADPQDPHNVVINGETMVPGQVSVVGTTPIIMATGAVVIGSSTIALPVAETQQPVATVESEVIAADGSNIVLPGGKTVTPGMVTVIKSVTVSVASSGAVVVGSSTIPLPAEHQQPVATVGSAVIVADGTNFILPGGTTLVPGAATVLNGVTASAGSSALVVGSSTIPLLSAESQHPVATVGSETIMADGTNFILPGGKTLAPGAATVLNGVTASAGSSALVIGSSTIPLPSAGSQQPVATVGSETIMADGTNFILPDGETLTPGAVTVINKVTVSVGSSALVIGDSTTIPVPGVGAIVTAGSRTITALQAAPGLVVIGSQTLTVGGRAATISGMVVSAASSSIIAVVDGTTTTVAVSSLAPSTTRRSGSLGATTSVPDLGWATDPPSSTTSSTRSEGSSFRFSRWVALLPLAAVLMA